VKKYIFFLALSFAASIHANTNCGFYLGLSNQVNFAHTNNRYGYKCNLTPDLSLSGSLGYRFQCRTIIDTIEFEFLYPNYVAKEKVFLKDYGTIQRRHARTLCFINVYTPFYLFESCTPYIGINASITTIRNKEHLEHWNARHLNRHGGPSQLIVGLRYPLNCGLETNIDYRFLFYHSRTQNHSLGLSIKRFF